LAVSLDDFGTGYSSLTYLQRFAIDSIKIDQSFVRNLYAGSTDLALCKAIVTMSHELGMTVVAEGVETQAQRDLLISVGCDYGQGYLFSRPLGVADFEAFYEKHRKEHH
jgi:EAL domain-containing protein (putative c-di-GMP-specific phosphodiesterase class I)